MKPPSQCKPVESPEFWKQRIDDVASQGKMTHQIIYDEQYDIWVRSQMESTKVIRKYVREGQSILDAGCGHGGLCPCLDDAGLVGKVSYLGVDISPDLLSIAIDRYPWARFEVQNLRSLPYPNEAFDWVICRSVESMIVGNVGREAWKEMLQEMIRVGKGLIIMEYETPTNPFRVRVYPHGE